MGVVLSLSRPPKISSTTKRRNHQKKRYSEATTRRGDRDVVYCPSELRRRQWALASEMAATTFQVEKVAKIPEIVTQMLRSKKKPIQKGRMLVFAVASSRLSHMLRVCRRLDTSGDELKKTLVSVARRSDNKTIRDEYCEET